MEGVPGRRGLLRRGWFRLVDGACPWGSFLVCPDRMGVIRYRLVVYPPGISEAERRRLRVWRGWPMWGALLWIGSYVIVTGLIGPRTALLISTAAYLGAGVVAFVRAGDVRARVRTTGATVMSGYPDPVSRDARRKLKALAAMLIDADHDCQLGLISAIEYEMTWWRVYDQIQPHHSSPHRTHWWERTA
jgi:hypothetical protein